MTAKHDSNHITDPMTPTNLVSGRLLARNTLLNFIGQAVPLLVGVVTIPFIVRGLGTERFGLSFADLCAK